MGALRALQKLESELLVELAPIYGCEEDDVPVELDLLAIFNMEEPKRLGELVRKLPYPSVFSSHYLSHRVLYVTSVLFVFSASIVCWSSR